MANCIAPSISIQPFHGEPRKNPSKRKRPANVDPTQAAKIERHTTVIRDRAEFIDLLAPCLETQYTKQTSTTLIEDYENEILAIQSRLRGLDIYLEYAEKYKGPDMVLITQELEERAKEMWQQLYGEFAYVEALDHARRRLVGTETDLRNFLEKLYAAVDYWDINKTNKKRRPEEGSPREPELKG
ncbi:hypothetical protein CERZMDRAFT_97525 [Cercospora zeae-maydis SCOH1-5]|uniref:Uncharacterized protein n=1 Tax=Cercospora zeae-maydis SCOH1-5 TaxID=717836 RepID=A0A6A6FFQ3_9PEZI|nr:hypothetical protein CERZMDRAFT_97525 [Cercospora zeae-maydis SCOH1-5]